MFLFGIIICLLYTPLFGVATPFTNRSLSAVPFTLPRPSQNPFANGIPTAPRVCNDLFNMSIACQLALKEHDNGLIAFGGGRLMFQDKSCSTVQKEGIGKAAWDAYTLSVSASKPPITGAQMAVWRTYVGPDYSEQQDRMLNNLKRVSDFRHSKKFDIIVTCNDPRHQCPIKVGDKQVGGYGWTYRGWMGQYHNIALCKSFFTVPDLEEKTEFIEEQIQNGNTKYAQEAIWQKNMGQYFLHEMMHLDSVGKPHVKDELVKTGRNGGTRSAYGPRNVYQLAQGDLESGGGAARSSTNADTYAWLANCLYFFEVTKVFPKPPRHEQKDEETPIMISLGDVRENVTNEELRNRMSSVGW
ncbi:Metalloproteases (zincins), catalytic [Fusarium agapanthi]|uniref:Metalloproteases (Zincins), catalytic n=1 Tax=Fusarium agapanthi TaxID=1803897 RepID=A0A9P5EE25_9HYPO|nr:Metalloproteases (zincins), catalytic [Fusarium agapanthi]